MATHQAALFAIVVMAIVFATAGWRIAPIAALILGAAAFGIGAGLSVGQMGKSFGNGFGEAAAAPGLAVVAAAWIGAMAETGGAARGLAAIRGGRFVASATPLIGLAAGMGAQPASAFALLRPLVGMSVADPVRLALAISLGQGLVLPSPVVIAATTILGADWRLVLGIGVPCAGVLAVVTGFVRRPVRAVPVTVAPRPQGRLAASGLAAVSAMLLGLLVVQALGDLPGEPFGGGGARELLLGLGRPFILLLLGVAGMALTTGRAGLAGPLGVAIGRAAPLVLLLGAAGGLAAMAQDSRMADGLAEALAGWRWHAGLLAPFLVACCLKLLLGSSPVAAISAAGLLQSALPGLGLDDATGHACAALATGAGAMAGTHVTDALFWLVRDAAGLTTARIMAWLCAGTLLQGLAALAILWLVHALALAV